VQHLDDQHDRQGGLTSVLLQVGGARAGAHPREEAPWTAAVVVAITLIGPGSGAALAKRRAAMPWLCGSAARH